MVRHFRTKYGYFSEDGFEYVITRPDTPRPWVNVISNGDYGLVISQTGSGYSWRTHASLNRINRWEQDLIKDEWGKYIYVKDRESGAIWSAGWKPICTPPDSYRCRHGIGYTTIESSKFGITSSFTVFIPNEEPLELWYLTLKNSTQKIRKLTIISFLELCLGNAPDWHREFHKLFIETEYDAELRALFATKRLWEVPGENGHWNVSWPYVAFHSCSVPVESFDCDKETFLGRYGNVMLPKAVVKGRGSKRCGKWYDSIFSLFANIVLEPGEIKTVIFTLGATEEKTQAVELIKKYRSEANVTQAFSQVVSRWRSILGASVVETPDLSLDILLNVWLKYQAISGRLWGRSAYYQTGGAYGFRDQLQDCLIFLGIDPHQTKQQILLHTRHQFKDGNVYHWWHPMTELGLPSDLSDTMLWLPYAVLSYIQETGDYSILDLQEPFVDEKNLATLYEHCTLAIDRALSRLSKRGLPLIAAGDWNDGLNAVGRKMQGESIWLGHFLYAILRDFTRVCIYYDDKERAQMYSMCAEKLKKNLNAYSWDGKWYRRATKDSGEPIGSKSNAEGKIYLNAQTWAIISGVAENKRSQIAMNAVEEHLEKKFGPLLFSPAYTAPDETIGYLTRYAPGVRENSSVYTHAAVWAIIAEVIAGRCETAYRLFSKINPINRGMKPDEYFAEPYVTPGNIEGPASPFFGRGSWTWYTGSAAWLYRAVFDWILGIRADFDGLIIDPHIPSSWPFFTAKRTFRGATYLIKVENPHRVNCGVAEIRIDGVIKRDLHALGSGFLVEPLPGDHHELVVVLGKRRRNLGISLCKGEL